MAGRPRLPIGTFGEIKTNQVASGRFRAWTRFRDWDGQTRQVTATGRSRNAAAAALKVELAARMRTGGAADSLTADSPFAALAEQVLESSPFIWNGLEHLSVMDTERLAGLGLEPVLTTRELADYLGVHVQAIYDLRAAGRGPAGIHVGREIRYRISDILGWLERLHEPEPELDIAGARGER